MGSTKNFKTEYEGIAAYWGAQMPLKACEEAGEFIKAVSKLNVELTLGEGEGSEAAKAKRDELIEEMADITITIQALAKYYDIASEEIGQALVTKVKANYDENGHRIS